MPRVIDMIQSDELEGTSPTDLHEQVERLQEENQRLERVLDEACEYLVSFVEAEDSEELEELAFSVRRFLENQEAGSF